MANYVLYNYRGNDLKLKIDAEHTRELEERLGDSIFAKIAEII